MIDSEHAPGWLATLTFSLASLFTFLPRMLGRMIHSESGWGWPVSMSISFASLYAVLPKLSGIIHLILAILAALGAFMGGLAALGQAFLAAHKAGFFQRKRKHGTDHRSSQDRGRIR